MIIDTTYILPLAGIEVDTDLLRAIVEGKARVGLSELKINLISLFELQAKASKLGVPPTRVVDAVNAVLDYFHVIPFYHQAIVEYAHRLRVLLRDYIDRVIVATAIALDENLVTEDKDILVLKQKLRKEYGVEVLAYRDLVG